MLTMNLQIINGYAGTDPGRRYFRIDIFLRKIMLNINELHKTLDLRIY